MRGVVSLLHDLFEVDGRSFDIPTEALLAPPWAMASALPCGPTTPSGSWACLKAEWGIILRRLSKWETD